MSILDRLQCIFGEDPEDDGPDVQETEVPWNESFAELKQRYWRDQIRDMDWADALMPVAPLPIMIRSLWVDNLFLLQLTIADLQQIDWSTRDHEELEEAWESTMPMLQWIVIVTPLLITSLKVYEMRRRSNRKKAEKRETENEKTVLVNIEELEAQEAYPKEEFTFFSLYHLWLILVALLLYTTAILVISSWWMKFPAGAWGKTDEADL